MSRAQREDPGEREEAGSPASVGADLRALTAFAAPCCGQSLSLFEAFDAALSAFRDRRWLRVPCPGCGASGVLCLEPGQTAWGHLAELRPPLFSPRVPIGQPGLEIQASPEGVVIELLHRRWFFRRSDS